MKVIYIESWRYLFNLQIDSRDQKNHLGGVLKQNLAPVYKSLESNFSFDNLIV